MAVRSFTEVAASLGRIQERVHGSNGIITRLQRAESFLTEARDLLRRFPDESATRAFEQASSALDHSRNASCGSLNDYIEITQELQSRIPKM